MRGLHVAIYDGRPMSCRVVLPWVHASRRSHHQYVHSAVCSTRYCKVFWGPRIDCAVCATIHNDYFRQHAIIDKHIQYPHQARRPAQTVTATVSFSLCRRIGWLACCSQYVCRWYLGLFDTYETEA